MKGSHLLPGQIPPGKIRTTNTGVQREEVHRMHANGMTTRQIATHFGVAMSTIRYHLRKPLDAPVLTKVDVNEVYRLRASGMKLADIARHLGVAGRTIYSFFPKTERDVPQFVRGPEILRLKESGMTVQQIADKLGISRKGVWSHLRNMGLGKPQKKTVAQMKQEMQARIEALQTKVEKLDNVIEEQGDSKLE